MNQIRLDTERIRRLCAEEHLSARELAGCLGASGQRLTRLLAGDGLTLRDVCRLGERLGVDGIELVLRAEDTSAPSPRPQAVADSVKVHAVLTRVQRRWSRGELAGVLDWDMRRTGRALAALDVALAASGQVLHRVNVTSVQLRARPDVLSDEERSKAERLPLKVLGLTKGSARLLLRLIEADGGLASTLALRGQDRGALVKQGLAEVDSSGNLQLHADVAFSRGIASRATGSRTTTAEGAVRRLPQC